MARHLTQIALQASSWLQGQIPLPSSGYSPTFEVQPLAFEWDNTTAHAQFVWHDCFDGFKCARLEVPMDWQGNSAERGKTVEIAVIKVEAPVPVTHPSYGGAVALNPGGPGNSGIGQVLRGGKHVQTILSAGPDDDPSTAKYFDIIGFDPRGVNNTRPRVTCFPDANEKAAWEIQNEAYGQIGSSNTSFDNIWASRRALAEGCSKRLAEEGIGNHIDTAPVARDILEIFERHGEWRAKEALRLLNEAQSEFSDEERSAMLARTTWLGGAELVQYWGFSYGTVLGATLSATYPDRVKRIVLDGVVDAPDYMQGLWSTNLKDTDATFVKLAEYCFQAGAEKCALYHPDGPAAITKTIEAATAKLQSRPIGIPGNTTHGPQIVTIGDLKRLTKEVIYNPIRWFPLMAQCLKELEKGDPSTLAMWTRSVRPKIGDPKSPRCIKDGPFAPSCFLASQFGDTRDAIACSDGESRLRESKGQFRASAKKIVASSKLLGEIWSVNQVACTAWHAEAHWKYYDQFRADPWNPILFVGNTIDPVTPLKHAFMMAKGFKSSGVLQQNSEGHCTYGAPSMCTGKALRKYFQTGELPGSKGGLKGWDGPGAYCEPDQLPFHGYGQDELPPLPKGETDAALWEALVRLNQVWP